MLCILLFLSCTVEHRRLISTVLDFVNTRLFVDQTLLENQQNPLKEINKIIEFKVLFVVCIQPSLKCSMIVSRGHVVIFVVAVRFPCSSTGARKHSSSS